MIYPDDFKGFCSTLTHKLTSLRKNILYILWNSEKPLKAYEILEELQKTKQNAMPPTVYRVLDYFVESGLVHKIESIQSYTLCTEHQSHYPSELLMVCNNCHQVHEVYDKPLHALIKKLSESQQFNLGQDVIELKGICRNCQKL